MNKRIVSLVLSLVLIVSSVVSVTAAIDTTGLTSVGVPMSAEYYTGDIASISGSVFTCDSFSTAQFLHQVLLHAFLSHTF